MPQQSILVWFSISLMIFPCSSIFVYTQLGVQKEYSSVVKRVEINWCRQKKSRFETKTNFCVRTIFLNPYRYKVKAIFCEDHLNPGLRGSVGVAVWSSMSISIVQ